MLLTARPGPPVELDRPARVNRLGLAAVVGHEDQRHAESRGRASVARPPPVARLVERRGRLVEQQHLGLERERAREHHALLLAHREPRGVAIGEARVEPGQLERPARRSTSSPQQARAEADVLGDRARQRRRQLRHEARRGGAARAGRARGRPCRGSGRRPRRGRPAGSAAAAAWTCPSRRGRRRAVEPDWDRRASRPLSTGRPPRASADALELEDRRYGDRGLGELRVQRVALRRARACARRARLRSASEKSPVSASPMTRADLAEVVRLEAARGERRRADPQARRHRRRPRVERHRVAVDGDADRRAGGPRPAGRRAPTRAGRPARGGRRCRR